MQKNLDNMELNATDLVGHLNCRHLTSLDLAVAMGTLGKPTGWDPSMQVLWERGAAHEKEYIDHLIALGHDVTFIDGVGIDPKSIAATLDAMRAGASIIVQGAFAAEGWSGRTDVLRRVDTPSKLGAWSYEVIDTKLARETRGGTVLQLLLYTGLLAAAQGRMPEMAYVVAPFTDFEPEPFRINDYSAYYRLVKASLARSVANDMPAIYPDKIEHCEICRWQQQCDARRRKDDHLSLVAGISKVQIGELAKHGVTTSTALAAVPLPFSWKPERGSLASFERVREQARIQLEGAVAGKVLYETLPAEAGFGLASLPQPSRGDVFLDLEGDPFIGDGGMEFLFGYSFAGTDGTPSHVADWALTREDERRVFEGFVDFIMARLEVYPDLHIFHYAPYEPGALKRLMGRYASKEAEIDQMLRSKLFVDLYGVVRQAIRASVESYSIKRLEPLFGFERSVVLHDANVALTRMQAFLELGDTSNINPDDRSVVEGYNRDDCISTWRLRDWLETVRAAKVASGINILRPTAPTEEASEDVTAWQAKIDELVARLTEGLPAAIQDRTAEQQARYILAHILDWHRREVKAAWWEYFRLSDVSVETLLEERSGLSGLTFVEAVGGTARAPIHRYTFPPQETDVRAEDDLKNLGGADFGKVEEISVEERYIDIKKRGDTAAVHPEAVFKHKVVRAQEQAEALVRIGEYVATHGIIGEGDYAVARDLLMKAVPRSVTVPLRGPGESALDAAMRIIPTLRGVLPIQGPPGAGKTHTGAHMICTLVKAGKTVGVTANSHKVILHLVEEAIKTGPQFGLDLQCIHKVTEKTDDQPGLTFSKNNAEVLAAIGTTKNVGSGTSWLWARGDAANTVDVLFVDEAAQMSLANVLAISHAAKSIVLLGDPQQLEQPMQGTHPEGTGVSALDHVLGGSQTIDTEHGLFLEQTWRLHPDICAFTSELFYEDRLKPLLGLEHQTVHSTGRVRGHGLRYLPVMHTGNQSSAPEEVQAIASIVDDILQAGTTWTDRHGVSHAVELSDILIIAPYNAQVFELSERIPGARIGTVDKFQGQEAPIVIYSVTTSSYADAPRGMEFLYSPNRLNVATSRARCLCILVANPGVFEAECKTPRQMQLANAYCRYREMAETLL